MKSKVFQKNNMLAFISLCLLAGFATYANCGSDKATKGAKFKETTGAKKEPSSFISVWETTENDESITLPLREGYEYDFTVDWGDGTEIQTIQIWDAPATTHTYAQPGQYTVTLKGSLQAWYFNNDGALLNIIFAGNADKILQVTEFGDMGWVNLNAAFAGCSQLTVFEGGSTQLVTDMSSMFMGAVEVMPSVGDWNTENVSNMAGMFAGAHHAQPEVSNWDTGSVVNMSDMFDSAQQATPDVSSWNTSNVINMSAMFSSTWSANPQVSDWDTGSVENMSDMFHFSEQANPDMSNWNFQNVTNMQGMFTGATSFTNQRYNQMLPQLNATATQTNVTLDVPGVKYYFANAAAKTNLIDNLGWTINDDGLDF